MDQASKQQIIDKLKQANNVLVTISTNPNVDQLSTLIGLTLLLNKMDKHATAVFSGQVPSTIEFLQPEKTIETNTDSLRDFIISLDKNKADKLRYKVEDQVVRIYITPYKTSLSENDLVFSQGDFNVDVVIALGIDNKAHIDAAITAHGKILHDATVISIIAGNSKVQPLGQINWQDPTSSSLAEMVVSISEAFGTGLIDNQMATAFLTGIVAETKRFSNNKTSPKVMTMSAQLLAAGANQQLIVSKLEPPVPVVPKYEPGKPVVAPKPAYEGKPEAKIDDGTLNVRKKDAAKATEVDLKAQEIHIDEQGNLRTSADLALPNEEPPMPEKPIVAPPVTPPEPEAPAPVAQKIVEPPVPSSPHALLNPDVQSPNTDTPFTANSEPEWAQTGAANSFDPLSAPGSPGNPMPAPKPYDVDSARSAVESALTNSHASEPITVPGSVGQTTAPTTANPTAPPPFPPPVTPVSGAVIPDNQSK